jgi:hypothetical protein
MILDYLEPGFVKLVMTSYVNKILDEMPEEMDGTATSPATAYMFQIVKGIEPLNETTSEFFHATVAKLLFLCERGRPDIQTAITFLCTRVQQPTKHDYNKLSRIIKYLRKTSGLVLCLTAEKLNIIKWWVDASYGVHHDMRSHTGGAMSMGTGVIYSTSKRQKLNTKSSTEAKLVGVDVVLPQALWTKYFMEAQGYGVTNPKTIKARSTQGALILNAHCAPSGSLRHHCSFIGHSGLVDRDLRLPFFLLSTPCASPFLQKKQFIQPHGTQSSCRRQTSLVVLLSRSTSTSTSDQSMLISSLIKSFARSIWKV